MPDPQLIAARALAKLPDPVIRALGAPAVVRDGNRLDPALRVMLRGGVMPEWQTIGVERSREMTTRQTRATGFELAPLASVRDLGWESAGAERRARVYVPHGCPTPSAALLFFHGGGHTLGDLDSHAAACRLIASLAGVRVLATDYRLAPEHPFPAAVEDSVAAFRWALSGDERLGIDPARIAVGGDSAGGNLAAAVSLAAREGAFGGAERMPAMQWLIYPSVDLEARGGSMDAFGKGFFLTSGMIAWARAQYVPDPARRADPYASPARAESLAGLPRTHIVTAGFDPLRDEAEAWAERLEQAGVEVTVQREPSMIHGFLNLTALSRAARAAVERAAAVLATLNTPEAHEEGAAT